MEENKNNVVDIQDAQVESAQNAEPAKEETTGEVKHTVFAKIDSKIVARREARAKKKAEKKPMDKAKKAAIIGGGAAFGLGLLGVGAKALLNAAANYADDEADGDDTEPEETLEIPAETETVSEEDTNEEET